MKEREMPKPESNGLNFISVSSWRDVKSVWKNDEDTSTFRREYAEQGYESWEEWRNIIIQPLHLDRLNWEMFSIDSPTTTVPYFRGGPFRPWEEMYYGGKTTPTFAEIVNTEGTDVSYRDKFSGIISSNKPITLIGIKYENDIYIVEGMHRATSIALTSQRRREWNSLVKLFLAESDLSKLETID